MRLGSVFVLAAVAAIAGVPADAVGTGAISRDIRGLVDAAFGVFSAPAHETASTHASLASAMGLGAGDNLLGLDSLADLDLDADADLDLDLGDEAELDDGDDDNDDDEEEEDSGDDDEDREDSEEDDAIDEDLNEDDADAGVASDADILLLGRRHLTEEADALVADAAHKSLAAELSDWRSARSGHHDRIDRRRIAAHNRKVAAFKRLEAARRKMYLAQQREAREMWTDYNRRQSREYAKAPKPIVFNHRVKAVVDDMVNRRFKQYTQFFVRHYLNHSPYVDISRSMKDLENRNPAPRRNGANDWFDKLPRGFKKKSKKPAEW